MSSDEEKLSVSQLCAVAAYGKVESMWARQEITEGDYDRLVTEIYEKHLSYLNLMGSSVMIWAIEAEIGNLRKRHIRWRRAAGERQWAEVASRVDEWAERLGRKLSSAQLGCEGAVEMDHDTAVGVATQWVESLRGGMESAI